MMRVFFGMKRDNFVITKKLLNIQSLKVKLSYLLTKTLRSDYFLDKEGILYRGSKIMNKKKINTIVGSIGAFIGVFVFITYIPQIIANLGGEKAQPWQPLTASISCLIWVIYGWTKEPKKDFILIVPNLAGVILGFLTFITAL